MKRHVVPFLQASNLQNSVDLPVWEYHAHTTYSDGTHSLAGMVKEALRIGLTRLILTEHTEPDLTHGLGWFGRYVEEIRALRRDPAVAGQLEIGIGLEVPVLDLEGHVLMSAAMASEAEYVLGAVHAYPGVGWELHRLTPEMAIDLEFKALMQLAENEQIDAIAHPGGICTNYVTPFPMELFEEVVIKATRNGLAIELNPAYQRPMAKFLEICSRHGAYVVPGSNAHSPAHLGDAYWAIRECLSKGGGSPLP